MKAFVIEGIFLRQMELFPLQ